MYSSQLPSVSVFRLAATGGGEQKEKEREPRQTRSQKESSRVPRGGDGVSGRQPGALTLPSGQQFLSACIDIGEAAQIDDDASTANHG
jgi:hypothetical protein